MEHEDESFMQNVNWINSLSLVSLMVLLVIRLFHPIKHLLLCHSMLICLEKIHSNKFYVYSPTSIVNLDLGWEISKTVNAGLISDYSIIN